MTETSIPAAPENDIEAIERLQAAVGKIRGQIGRVIVGQDEVVEQLLTAVFARGHCILEGVPGLAKTLLVSTLAQSLHLTFNRIQFTPDLMPSDITGTEVIQEDRATGLREFKFLPGPVFSNVILADEINRTPPKTQAALLEAMQERQVTVGGERHVLPAPFFVLATQNPIEQEGTYPLPEAQQDRFMFKVFVSYPSWNEEFDVIRLTTADHHEEIEAVLTEEEIESLQHVVRRVPISDHAIRYAMKLVRQTRIGFGEEPEGVRDWVTWGAGPRACQYLVLGAKARAAIQGRHHVATEDIQAVAKPVLRHRIITNFNAEAEGITPDRIVERLIKETPAQEGAIGVDGAYEKVLRS